MRHSGVPRGISSHSANPVIAVGAVRISPAIRASHHAVAVLCSLTPSLERTAIAAANVYAPIVASVSGGCSG